MDTIANPGGEPLEYIDKQRALDLLDKALTERGEDYVYEQFDPAADDKYKCRYFTPDGQPSCIVGHALALHGLTSEQWAARGREGDRPYTLDFDFISFDAGQVWTTAQVAQDDGLTWGEAVAEAREKAEWL